MVAWNKRVTVAPAKRVLLMLNLRPPRNRRSEIEWNRPALAARSGCRVFVLRRCMSNEREESRNMTADECDEFAAALVEDAAALPHGPKKEDLLRLAESYSNLAEMKRMVLRKSN